MHEEAEEGLLFHVTLARGPDANASLCAVKNEIYYSELLYYLFVHDMSADIARKLVNGSAIIYSFLPLVYMVCAKIFLSVFSLSSVWA